MKKFTEQFKKQAEGIRLRTDERNELRERLLAYMEYHPLAEKQEKAFKPFSRVSNFVSVSLISRLAGATAILFLVVVPAMAEKALPGDILYPVKVRFNEEIKGSLVTSPYQKVEWQTERLEKRVAEAKLLADAGKLTPAAEADLANAIKHHSEAAMQNIASIRESDSEEAALVSISMSSALEVQEEFLDNRNTGVESSDVLSDAFKAAKVDLAVKETDHLSYSRLEWRLEAETTRAYEYLDSINDVITAEQKKDIERRLEDVKKKAETANELKDENEAEAIQMMTEALVSTSKIISFMTNLEVRNSVSIEELVPVVLTEDERAEIIHNKLSEAIELSSRIEVGIAEVATSSNDYAALNDGWDRYQDLMETASSSLEDKDLDSAEAAAVEAVALAKQLEHILLALGINLGEDEEIDSDNE